MVPIESPCLILPGYSSSGPTHWQTRWQELHGSMIRVEQDDWINPHLDSWIKTLDAAVSLCEQPPILIAHSLATILVSHWAARHHRLVRGAFLVAPADVESPEGIPEILRGFAPIPTNRLPFPSLLIASENDHYASYTRVQQLGKCWGSTLQSVGNLGHINADSGIGDWGAGWDLFQAWAETLPNGN